MQVDIRDPASIPGSGRSPGGTHGNPLQYPCPENPMDRGSWWATVHGVIKSQTCLKRLRSCAHSHTHTHTPPRHFTDCGLRHSFQSFWEKLSWNSGLRGRLQVWHTFRSLWNWICLQCGKPGFDPWVWKIPWRRNGYPLRYSCLVNFMDWGA